MTAVLHPYLASITNVSMTDLVAMVGELNSSFLMYPHCLLPPATILPLVLPVFFSFKKMWDLMMVFVCLSVSSDHLTGQKN